ncbi:MAG: CBS domain-containing protein, partial [Verrucomicrobia bacterium]|nr:CBS domain-containing protein [Verrucomicrobiota bacterium]
LGVLGIPRVAMTSSMDSHLAALCEHALCFGVHEEACPLRLAPSTSTAVMLALGDALALAVQEARGFEAADYAKLHPAGALGRRLSLVGDLMRTGERIAVVREDATVTESVVAISKARCGLCLVVDVGGALRGVYSDGDLRRDCVEGVEIATTPVEACMTRAFRSVESDTMVGDCINLMCKFRINALPVTGSGMSVLGMIDIQDVA